MLCSVYGYPCSAPPPPPPATMYSSCVQSWYDSTSVSVHVVLSAAAVVSAAAASGSASGAAAQGLQELYDFVQSHPDANISPLFDVCSPEFRNFVEKSLRNIARQRSREAKAPASSTSVGGMQDNLDSLRSLLPSGGRAASGESAGAVATDVHAETTVSGVLLAVVRWW